MTLNNKLFGLFFSCALSICSLQIFAQTDAALIEIISPLSGSDCGGSTLIAPTFVISNEGNTPITLLFYSIQIDNQDPIQYIWTGLLNATDTVVITEDEIDWGYGSHNINISIDNVNGLPDVDISNNALSVDFEIIDGQNFTIEILTDFYPEETSFSINGTNGFPLVQEGGFTEAFTLYTFDYCLPINCYTFNIEDDFGDGIGFGGGYYRLIDTYGQVLAEGGQFQFSFQEEFCLEVLEFENLDIGITDVLPNDDFCGTSFNPSVVIRNEGLLPITEVVFAYELNGTLIDEFTWNGFLTSIESEEVVLPFLESPVGENTLSISILSVNGVEDEDPNNDAFTVALNAIDGISINVDVLTDNDPDETAFFIIDENGNTVASENDFPAGFSVYTFGYCLDPGCYTFNLTDDNGDGLGGDGAFSIYGEGIQILETELEFEDLIQEDFCIGDLAPLKISIESLSPNNPICANFITPNITLKNVGEDDINEVILSYELNGIALGEFTWNGSLTNLDETSIQLPLIDNLENSNTLTVSILSLNGQSTDESKTVNFIATNGAGFSISLETDVFYFFQVPSYFLTNSESDTIDQLIGLPNQDLFYCLPEDCYTLTVIDPYNGGFVDVEINSDAGYPLSINQDYTNELIIPFCTNAPLQNDGAVLDVLSPSENTFICGNSISPKVLFTNVGFNNITEIDWEYSFGSIPLNYTWEGNLAPLEQTIITFPELSGFPFGPETFAANILSVNGETDQNSSNNSIFSNFDFIDETGINITIETGSGYNLNTVSLNIIDPNGLIAFEQNGLSENKTYNFPVCLKEGCYKIVFTSFFGGVVQLSYEVKDDLDNTLLSQENASINGLIEDIYCSSSAQLLSNDVSLINILNQANTPICDASITPVFEVINLGTDTITEMLIEYKLIEDEPNFYQWTGSFGLLDIEEISLPQISNPGGGFFDLSIDILSINGQIDQATDNNNQSIDLIFTTPPYFTLTQEENTLTISFDDYNLAEPVSIQWDDGSTEPTITLTDSSTIGVTLIDGNGCSSFQKIDPSWGLNSLPSSANNAAFDYDVNLIKIISPISEPICNGEFTSLFEVVNTGSKTITQMTVNYFLEDGETNIYNWSGNLPFSEATEILLPALENPGGGFYDFNIDIVSINGEIDEDASNNSKTVDLIFTFAPAFEVIEGENTLEIIYDNLTEPVGIEWSNGSTESSIEFNNQEQISVTLTDGNGCSSIQVFGDATSISSLPSTAQITLYPNPANEQIFLSHALPDGYTLYLKDLMGKTLYRQNIDPDLVKIDLGEITNGLYLVEITNGVETGIYKVLVIR